MRTFIAGVTIYLLNHYIHDGFNTIVYLLLLYGVLLCIAQDIGWMAKHVADDREQT